jgi:hypothetical protein
VTTGRGQRRLDQREAELAEHLLANDVGGTNAKGIGAVVGGVGTFWQVKIADAEVAAIVLAARVFDLELARRADQVLDARTEVHGVGRSFRQPVIGSPDGAWALMVRDS